MKAYERTALYYVTINKHKWEIEKNN